MTPQPSPGHPDHPRASLCVRKGTHPRQSLPFQLRAILKHNVDGSYETHRKRGRSLLKFVRDLRADGFKLNKIQNLKPRHIERRIAAWKAKGLSTGSIKNNMTYVRWLAEKLGKPRMVPSNDELGIARRVSTHQDKSWSPADELALLDAVRQRSERLHLQIRLMRAFGLRFREAATLRPAQDDQGSLLRVVHGTKGGRPRSVPILGDEQRRLLEEAKTLAQRDGSLIPEGSSFRAWRDQAKHIAQQVGLNKDARTNYHALRHAYGQARYLQLTGQQPPCKLSPQQRAAASPEMVARDRAARAIIAEELGHGRISVTSTYLGPPL